MGKLFNFISKKIERMDKLKSKRKKKGKRRLIEVLDYILCSPYK